MKTRSNTTQGQLDKVRDDRIAKLEAQIERQAKILDDYKNKILVLQAMVNALSKVQS